MATRDIRTGFFRNCTRCGRVKLSSRFTAVFNCVYPLELEILQ